MISKQYLAELAKLEKMKGDLLELVTVTEENRENADYGVRANSSFDLVRVPGYVTNPMRQSGLILGGSNSRTEGLFNVYLNVAAGFDPNLLNRYSYLSCNRTGLYEMLFRQKVSYFGAEVYRVYEIRETTDSKRLFATFKQLFTAI